jgi:predicted RNA-binding protein YlxR (DUF448 family)
VACRTRQPLYKLERLGVVDGRLIPDPDGHTSGRGAWVCPTLRCVERLVKNPRCLFRSLKMKGTPKVDGLRAALLQTIRARCLSLLERCRRAGLVISGPAKIQSTDRILVLITASDASTQSLAPLVTHVRHQAGTSSLELGLDRRGLGALLNKGPRVAIAILSGRPSVHLMEHLQRHLSLS